MTEPGHVTGQLDGLCGGQFTKKCVTLSPPMKTISPTQLEVLQLLDQGWNMSWLQGVGTSISSPDHRKNRRVTLDTSVSLQKRRLIRRKKKDWMSVDYTLSDTGRDVLKTLDVSKIKSKRRRPEGKTRVVLAKLTRGWKLVDRPYTTNDGLLGN